MSWWRFPASSSALAFRQGSKKCPRRAGPAQMGTTWRHGGRWLRASLPLRAGPARGGGGGRAQPSCHRGTHSGCQCAMSARCCVSVPFSLPFLSLRYLHSAATSASELEQGSGRRFSFHTRQRCVPQRWVCVCWAAEPCQRGLQPLEEFCGTEFNRDWCSLSWAIKFNG